MNRLILILTLMISSTVAFAITPEEQVTLDVSTKVTDIWIKVSELYTDEEKFLDASSDEWRKSITPFVSQIIEEELDSKSLTNIEQNHLKNLTNKIISNMNWDGIRGAVRNLFIPLKKSARIHGVLVPATLVLGFACKFTVAGVLASMGMEEMAALLIASPAGVAFPSAAVAIGYFNTKKRMTQYYGSRKEFNKYQKLMKELQRKVSVPIKLDGEEMLISISKRNKESFLKRFVHEIKKHAGFVSAGVELSDFMKFCTEQKLVCTELEAINLQKSLTRTQKTILALVHLESVMDDKSQAAFKVAMSENLRSSVLNLGTEYKAFKDWVEALYQLGSIDEVSRHFEKVPKSAKPSMVVIAWNEIMLEKFSTESKVIEYGAYRRLKRNLEKIEAEALKAGDAVFDDSWVARFKSYLEKSIGKARCKEGLVRYKALDSLLSSIFFGSNQNMPAIMSCNPLQWCKA